MEHKNIYQLVLAGVLCAIGLVVPMVMPKVIIGPMSFTLGAHAAIFLAMLISPKVAAAVCLGTTMGFFVTTPLIIAARAATHIIFALVGALIIRRYPNIMESFVAGIGLNLGLAVLHALGEVLVVAPFFFKGYMFTQEQLSNGFVMSVIVLVGAGTVLTTEQVDRAVAAGAKFIVAPGLNPKVVEYCVKKGIPVAPGTATPSEMEQAMSFGLDVVKFFPAENNGGLSMIKAVAAPYVGLKFMPTGGINATNVRDYLAYDRILCCGGSWMVKGDLIKAGDFAKIEELTREAAAIVKEVRG